MAKITNRFVHFKTKSDFTTRLEAGDIQESSIVFIQDTDEIWTHGNIYGSNNSYSSIELTTNSEYALSARNKIRVGDIISAESLDLIIAEIVKNDTDGVDHIMCIFWYGDHVGMQFTWDGNSKKYLSGDLITIIDVNNIDNQISSVVKDKTITAKKLTDLPALSNTSIAATDTILNSFAKLQGQINNKANTSSLPIAGVVGPNAAGNGAVGISNRYAREDHVHPLQTTISGNATTSTKLQTPRTISMAGAVSGSTTFDGSSDISINSSLMGFDASKIISGIIDIERLPKGALERLVKVANQSARFALTAKDVQDGDTVQQMDTGIMYFVVDITELNSEAGYNIYTAGTATSVPWSGITKKPTFASVATSGSYTDLFNKPAIPTNVSQLINDAGYITRANTVEKATTLDFTILDFVPNYGSGVIAYQGIDFELAPDKGWFNYLRTLHYNSTGYFSEIAQSFTNNDYHLYTRIMSSGILKTWEKIAFISDIPTVISQLTNDSGYTTQNWVASNYLPLSGGELTGTLSLKDASINFTSGAQHFIRYASALTGIYFGPNTMTTANAANLVIDASGVFPGATNIVDLGKTDKTWRNIYGQTIYEGDISLSAKYAAINSIPTALPSPHSISINGIYYNGSSQVNIVTPQILTTTTLDSSVVSAGYNYNNTVGRTITALSGFSEGTPDSIVVSSYKLSFSASNTMIMDGIGDITGNYYIYCFSYTANGRVAINGAGYA